MRRRWWGCLATVYRPPRVQTRGFAGFDLRGSISHRSDSKEIGGDEILKRKPTRRVIALADKLMSLTVSESADLVAECQARIPGGQMWDIPGRTTFPHPAELFAGQGAGGVSIIPPMGGGMGGMQMPMGMPAGMPAAPAPAAQPAAAAVEAGAPADAAAEPVAEKKQMVAVKLTAFDAAKKINIIKEVRAFTGLGLKESKEFVEGLPKVLKKGVPIAEAETIKTKFEAVTGKIELE
mmetsp:Transcript_19258/g.42727  ORF Transcript_19258/g.42727 Transcript_19258/m.42727 type:complete len:236 (-) Transcript_19258:68-775(-)